MLSGSEEQSGTIQRRRSTEDLLGVAEVRHARPLVTGVDGECV